MNSAALTIPEGYWQDARGNLVLDANVKDVDKLRDQTVRMLIDRAKNQSALLKIFKLDSMTDVEAFIATSHEQHGVKIGGDKGNVSLVSYDGKYKVTRQMSDTLSFDERIQAAQALIEECAVEWSKGASDNIRSLINHAFQVDKEGKISTARVLGLRQLKIDDPKWLQAMDAISESIHSVRTKPYIRFYERDENGKYQPISLDLASL